jgi:hypothetical protein
MRTLHDLADRMIEINEEGTVSVVRKRTPPKGLAGTLRAENAKFQSVTIQKKYLSEYMDELGDILQVGIDEKRNAIRLSDENGEVKIFIMAMNDPKIPCDDNTEVL